jgi:hypothetical protein
VWFATAQALQQAAYHQLVAQHQLCKRLLIALRETARHQDLIGIHIAHFHALL